jgi:hypothetical protein
MDAEALTRLSDGRHGFELDLHDSKFHEGAANATARRRRSRSTPFVIG